MRLAVAGRANGFGPHGRSIPAAAFLAETAVSGSTRRVIMKKVQALLSRYKLVWVVLLCAMALLFFSAATTHAAPANACGGYHYVQKGETLYSISKWYGVPIQAMMQANPSIPHPSLIYAGTYLYIPCGPGDPGTGGGCRYLHYVAWGQTLNEIALHYMVSPYAIAQANGITDLDLIYAGESLCIP